MVFEIPSSPTNISTPSHPPPIYNLPSSSSNVQFNSTQPRTPENFLLTLFAYLFSISDFRRTLTSVTSTGVTYKVYSVQFGRCAHDLPLSFRVSERVHVSLGWGGHGHGSMCWDFWVFRCTLSLVRLSIHRQAHYTFVRFVLAILTPHCHSRPGKAKGTK